MAAALYSHKLQIGASLLRHAGVIAYPTEAVWGLGCDPYNQQAVYSLLSLKRRQVAKGLILVASSMEQFLPYLQGLDSASMDRLDASWPGPTTWLVPDNGTAPWWISGDFETVALRVSAHPVVAGLCRAFAAPMVSTSANRAGLAPMRWSWQINRQWGKQLDGIVHGELGSASRPSMIRDLLSDTIVRQG